MRLEKLEASDFLCFKSLEVPIREQGLVCVLGHNLDSDAANSNGSGKSSLFKAVSWGLFGQTVDGMRYDEVIRRGASVASVSISFTYRSKLWTLTRERRKGKPSLTLANEDGEVRAPVEGLQAQIESMLGLDFEAFRNTVLYGQGDAARFADPRTTDSVRKEMLFKILRLGVLSRCHEIASERRKELVRAIDNREYENSKFLSKVEGIGLEGLQAQMDRWDAEREASIETTLEAARGLIAEARVILKEPKTMLEALRSKLTRIEKPHHPIGVDELEMAKLRKALDGRQMGLKAVELDISALLGERGECDRALNRLDGKLCPICTSPLDSGAPAALKKDLLDRRAATFSREEAMILDVDTKKEAIKEAQLKIDDELAKSRLRSKAAESRLQEERELRGKIDALERRAREAEERKIRAGELMRRVNIRREEKNPFVELFQKASDQVETISAQMDSLALDTEHDRGEMSLVSFWEKGFGPKGLPSYILDRTMVLLTDRANHYLRTLADGDIQVFFTTQKELKSKKGEVRDEITISWQIEGLEGTQPSGGQWKKIEIATDLALMDLVATEEDASCQILLMDEVLDGLDVEGRRRVVQLLRELRSRKETVMVISHETDLLDEFEQVFLVSKRDGVSTFHVGGGEDEVS